MYYHLITVIVYHSKAPQVHTVVYQVQIKDLLKKEYILLKYIICKSFFLLKRIKSLQFLHSLGILSWKLQKGGGVEEASSVHSLTSDWPPELAQCGGEGGGEGEEGDNISIKLWKAKSKSFVLVV